MAWWWFIWLALYVLVVGVYWSLMAWNSREEKAFYAQLRAMIEVEGDR